MTNVSREERLRSPPKPEFGMTLLLVGALVGEVLATAVELAGC